MCSSQSTWLFTTGFVNYIHSVFPDKDHKRNNFFFPCFCLFLFYPKQRQLNVLLLRGTYRALNEANGSEMALDAFLTASLRSTRNIFIQFSLTCMLWAVLRMWHYHQVLKKLGNLWVGSCLPLPCVSALVPLSLSDTPQPLSLAVSLGFSVFPCFHQSSSTANDIVSISKHFGAKLLTH